jgi:hypothetical protein
MSAPIATTAPPPAERWRLIAPSGASPTLATKLAESAHAFAYAYERNRFGGEYRPAWVYVIEAPAASLFKIGNSLDARQRLQTLSGISPVPLRLVATAWGCAAVERTLHRAFADTRSHGEWFRDSADLRELIALMGDEERTSGWKTPNYWKPGGAR